MKKHIFIFFVFIASYCSAQVIEIKGSWKFQPGDNQLWSDISYNDKGWSDIPYEEKVENHGFPKFDGLGWFRKTIEFPKDYQNNIKNDYPYLTLILGKIDDADETYFNGKKIGSTANMKMQTGGESEIVRKYLIPIELINWDGSNVLSVRVSDFGGGCGIFSGPFKIYPSSFIDFVKLNSTLMDAQENVYPKGKAAKFNLIFQNKSKEYLEGKVTFEIFTDTHVKIKEQEIKFKTEAGEEFSYDLEFKNTAPGFYVASFLCFITNKGDALNNIIFFGNSPEEIQAPLTRPEDFKDFWDKTKKELTGVKPKYVVKKSVEYSTNTIDVYEVEMRSLDSVRVRGWYSAPKKEGRFPALIRMIGYSGSNMPVTDIEDFAVLSFNIRGHGNSKDDVNPGFPQYITSGIENKEQYIYRGAYMDCVRAVDFICSRAEVDSNRIGVYGGSQGGALSIATAALDKRIKVCAPHVPFLSNFRYYFQINNFPREIFENYLKNTPDMTWEKVYSVLDYFDIKNLAPWVSCPVFMGIGMKDQVCPPATNFAAYNNIGSKKKQVFVFANYGHAVPNKQHQKELEWLRKMLK